MQDAKTLEYILQTAAGVVLFCSTALAAFALKEIFRLRSDHSALKAQVESQMGESQRSFTRMESWLQSMDEKLDRLMEK